MVADTSTDHYFRMVIDGFCPKPYAKLIGSGAYGITFVHYFKTDNIMVI